MDPEPTNPRAEADITEAVLDQDRAAAERALETAQRNPVLSSDQACAVAQVHALLAIERRLGQLLAALVAPGNPSDHTAARASLAVLP
jgi:hypothetical protein